MQVPAKPAIGGGKKIDERWSKALGLDGGNADASDICALLNSGNETGEVRSGVRVVIGGKVYANQDQLCCSRCEVSYLFYNAVEWF